MDLTSGITIGVVLVGAVSVIVSVTLAEIRGRKEHEKLWKEVNENRKRLNRIRTMRGWEKHGSFTAGGDTMSV